MNSGLTVAEVEALNEATLRGWALGSEKFKTILAKQANRRVSPAKRGRPAKSQSPSAN
jgi:putative transposase